MREAFKNKRGVQFGLNNFLTDLMFADDSAVFADADAKATNILYNITHIAQSYGLKINADKTKVITTDGSSANIYLDGIQIEQVEKFKYLGSLLQEKKVASTTEVYSRIGQATAAFASLKWCLWKKHNITIKTKIHLFQTLIIPILLYGSETWTTLKSDVKKLETFQLRYLRQILDVSLCDHYQNETVRMKCDNQPLIKEQIQKCRRQWFDHVC